MSKQKILIIDDDETTVLMLQQILAKNGFEHEMALNGKAGLDILNKDEKIDGVILDIIMPEMAGHETLKHIKQTPKIKDTPVLMLTGVTAIADVSECLSMGASDYMVKPFDEETLISRLQKILPLTIGFED